MIIKIVNILTIALLSLNFSGCAAGGFNYAADGIFGGYQDKKISANRYKVVYRLGSAVSSRKDGAMNIPLNYTLLRASEITLLKGDKYFKIEEFMLDEDNYDFPTIYFQTFKTVPEDKKYTLVEKYTMQDYKSIYDMIDDSTYEGKVYSAKAISDTLKSYFKLN